MNRIKSQVPSKRARAAKRLMVEVRKAAPCHDCGASFPGCAMDFDHPPGSNKVAPVAAIVNNGSASSLVAEMAKCDVVCANCHRIRTAERGWDNGRPNWAIPGSAALNKR